jgi:hypothetical protein
MFQREYTSAEFIEECKPIKYSSNRVLNMAGQYLLMPVNPKCVRGFIIQMYIGTGVGKIVEANVYTAFATTKYTSMLMWEYEEGDGHTAKSKLLEAITEKVLDRVEENTSIMSAEAFITKLVDVGNNNRQIEENAKRKYTTEALRTWLKSIENTSKTGFVRVPRRTLRRQRFMVLDRSEIRLYMSAGYVKNKGFVGIGAADTFTLEGATLTYPHNIGLRQPSEFTSSNSYFVMKMKKSDGIEHTIKFTKKDPTELLSWITLIHNKITVAVVRATDPGLADTYDFRDAVGHSLQLVGGAIIQPMLPISVSNEATHAETTDDDERVADAGYSDGKTLPPPTGSSIHIGPAKLFKSSISIGPENLVSSFEFDSGVEQGEDKVHHQLKENHVFSNFHEESDLLDRIEEDLANALGIK